MIRRSDNSQLLDVALKLDAAILRMPEDVRRILYSGAADAVVLVLQRVRFRGQDANNGILFTKAKKRVGPYSKQWAGIRVDRGRQVGRVDLTFTGKMLLDFNLTERDWLRAGVGFMSEKSHEQANGLEEYYGSEIFVPSQDEEDGIVKDLQDSLFNLIDKI